MKTGIDTARLKQTVDLIELAGRHVELRKVSPKEHHGPCPWCGGDDRFRVTADYFACRQCGRKGDAIEFIKQRQNVDFIEAIKILGGDVSMGIGEKVKPAHKPVEQVAKLLDDNRVRKLMEAHRKLVEQSTSVSRRCMAYLLDRGITMDTVKAFSVGYDAALLPGLWDAESGKVLQPTKDDAPYQPYQLAVSLPWFNHDGVLVAVKYRFIEPHIYTVNGREQRGKDGKGVRFTSYGPSKGNAFGWQTLQGPSKVDTIFICEGEINGLSLWQAGRGVIDVLSVGGQETNKVLPPTVVAKAKEYKHRFTWFDERKIADNFALQIDATAIQSPPWKDEQGNQLYHDDGKPKHKDANDFLRAGKLGALLTAMLGRLGVSLPAESSHTDSTPHHTPTSHTDVQEAAPILSFEPAPVPTMATQAAYDANKDDLTSFVGLDVTDGVMDVLTGRAKAYGWNYGTSRTADGWHIHRLVAY
ncbi:MAG TPA: CHC2 zinc finger domain-containing protein [Cellvibrionaceae bacterium]|nr:CHC2 zinc finger domain-containing protein [Cellvibrionaceae bacterium]